MYINSLHKLTTSQVRPEVTGAAPVTKVEETLGSPVPSAPVPAPRDEVQISDAGRALASRSGGADALTPERTAEIRQRVLDGAYDSLSMVDAVARRVLDSGDLW